MTVMSTEPAATADPAVLSGRVNGPDGRAGAGVTVAVVARRLRSEVPLGETVTGADGGYRVEYPAQDGPADIVVRAVRDGKPVAETVAGNGVADLRLPDDPSPEYETLLAAVTPLLDGAAVVELGEQDLDFLARATGRDSLQIGYLVTAARHEAATGLPAEAFYGLLRQGLSGDLPKLAEQDTAVRMGLAAAAAARIIAPADPADFAERLLSFAVETAVGAAAPSPIGQLFAVAVADEAAREHLYAAYLDRGGDTTKLWTDLADDPIAAPHLERLRLALRLGGLTDNNAQLVAALLAKFDSGELARPEDLAGLNGEWPGLIGKTDGVPQAAEASLVATDEDAKHADLTARYARAIQDRVAAAYPTAHIMHRLSADGTDSTPPAARFLAANPGFDVTTTPVNTVTVPEPEARAELAVIQRTYKVAPRFEAMQALRDNGFTSSYAISRTSPDAFAKAVAQTVPEDEARTIHSRAAQLHAVAVNLVADLRTSGQVDVPWLAEPQALTAQIPDWEELFGSADYLQGPDSLSLYSEAAYLTDLIDYLADLGIDYGSTTPVLMAATEKTWTPLSGRRPDLWDVKLSPDNTNLTLPYVDLVNELLESAISPETDIPATARQSSGSVDELRIQPQHVNQGAYEKLRISVYPWDLPFDLWHEKTATYLGAQGASREVLLTTLGEGTAAADLADDERVGVSGVAAAIITGEVLDPLRTLPEFYGYPAEMGAADLVRALSTVRTLLDRGGMRFAELPELLDTRFVNPGRVLRIDVVPATPADTTVMTVAGLDTGALDRLHRFVRLKRALGWTAARLDRAIAASNNGGKLDRATLRSIAGAGRLAARLGLRVEQVLPFYGPFDAHAYRAEEDLPVYDELFLTPAVVPDVPGAVNPFELNADRTEIKTPASLRTPVVTAALIAALQVTDEDLAALISGPRVVTGSQLTVAALSALYRTVTLASALSLTVPELLRLMELAGVDGPFPASTVDSSSSETEVAGGAPLDLTVRIPLPAFGSGYETEVAGGARILPPTAEAAGATGAPIGVLVERTIGFLDAVAAIMAAGFSVPELDAVLADTVEPSGGVLPDAAASAAILTALRAALQTVYTQTSPRTDANGDITRRDLALLGWDAGLVQDAVATLLGTVTYTATLTALPDAVEFPAGTPIRYDPVEQQLVFTGPMTRTQHEALRALPGGGDFLNSVEAIFKAPRTFVATRMKAMRIPVYAARLDTLPAEFPFPPSLAGKVFYDATEHTLRSRGYLGEADVAALLGVPSAPDAFKKAVADLQVAQQASPALDNILLTAGDADRFFDDPVSPVTRFAVVLAKVNPVLRRVLAETAIKQQLGDAAGVTAAVADALLGTWLRVGGRAALEEFLAPEFVGSDSAVTITPDSFPAQFATLATIQRVTLVLTRLRVTAAELPLVFGDAPSTGWLDLTALPQAPVAGASPLFAPFVRLLNLIRLRDTIPRGADTLLAVFTAVGASSATVARLVATLAERTGWNAADLDVLAKLLGLSVPSHFADEANLARLLGAVQLVRRLGVSADRAVGWLAPRLTSDAAQAAWQAAKSRHSADDWPTAAAPMQDAIRELQRSALVSYLVANPLRDHDSGLPLFTDVNGLHDHFLLDVEMTPIQQTTRIAQAIYSVQLFLQRCQLDLEPQAHAGSRTTWARWEWMKQYRLWEANQKIFLYPENYLQPELRDGKSPFFAELESELLQGDVTEDTVETVFLNYLEKVSDVGRLLPCGMYTHLDQNRRKTFYLFARTESTPRVHYFRQQIDDGAWTAWERIDLDIEAETLVPVVWNDRLHIFWLGFTETADAQAVAIKDGSGAFPLPSKYLKIQLNWSRYVNGSWESKKVSKESLSTNQSVTGIDQFSGYAFHKKDGYVCRPEITADGDLKIWCIFNTLLPLTIFGTTGYFVFNGNFELSARRGAVIATDLFITGKDYAPPVVALPTNTEVRNNEFVERPSTNGWMGIPVQDQPVDKPDMLIRLFKTPGAQPFRLLYPHQYLTDWSDLVMCFTDGARSYLLKPYLQPQGDGSYLIMCDFITSYHPYTELFVSLRKVGGLDALFERAVQTDPESITNYHFDFGDGVENSYYFANSAAVKQPYPTEFVDFTLGGSYSPYNWELFFFVPMLIADRLSTNQKFADAQKWFHKVFNPTLAGDDGGRQRFWITKPFYERADPQYLAQQIELLLKALGHYDFDVYQQVRDWMDHPFQPDRVAQLRTTAYQKAVVMRYLDNLIAWGDQLYRQDTLESINQATQLYVLAAELLGRRPESVTPLEKPAPLSYNELNPHSGGGEQLVAVENLLPAPSATMSPSLMPSSGPAYLSYFFLPRNEKLVGYWDTVTDRLVKIRHGQNIDGVTRQTAFFGAPIDPNLLVRATAAGLDLGSVLDDISAPLPHYRFGSMVGKAKELANEVKAFGSAMLSALEKRDGESLARLRSGHEIATLTAARRVRLQQVSEAVQAVESLERSKAVAEAKHKYYLDKTLHKLNDKEEAHTRLTLEALDTQEAARTINMVASVISVLPDVKIGSPTTTGVTWGSSNVIAGLRGWSEALSTGASMKHTRAGLSATLGGYDRRFEDWQFQVDQAQKEIEQYDSQIVAAKVRQAITEAELDNHDLQLANTKEADEFLHAKYTGKELYDWMVGQLSTSYFQAYQLAYDVAKRAERAYRHELSVEDSDFVRFGYWDSLHKGLLAGERLASDLNRMDAAFLEANAREFELSKRISLAQIDPKALVALKETGKCFVSLPEALFDVDTPGHYLRRIKNLTITVPCVAGPYTSVNLTATLTKSSVRVDPRLPEDGGYARGKSDTRFRDYAGPVQSIVTSTGQEDAGLFETNLRDERFLPFEGAGVIGEWQLSLPARYRQFDYESISDVVLHLRYTARNGGEGLAAAATGEVETALKNWVRVSGGKGLFRTFSARREFADQWARFLATPNGGTGTVSFTVSKARFPYLFSEEHFAVEKPELVLVLSQELVPDGSKRYVDCYPATALMADLTSPTGGHVSVALDPDANLAGLPRAGFPTLKADVTGTDAAWTVRIDVGQLDPNLLRDGRLNPEAFVDLLLVSPYTFK